MKTEIDTMRNLAYVLYDPSDSTEPDMYMAQVPSFPNCVAWGDTAEDTIANLESVVVETIRVYQERGYELPPDVVVNCDANDRE